MNKTVITTAGALFAGFLASLCCIGPLVISVIGAGSLGFAAAFMPYRTYLLAFTILSLTAGFYFTYRKHEVKCADGTCKVESASTLNKVILWVAAGVALVFMFFPQILTLF